MLVALALSALWLATPTPSPGPPLTAAIGSVQCPSRQAPVNVTNDTGAGASYTLRTNGKFIREEFVPPDSIIKGTAQLAENTPTTITVTVGGTTIARADRTAKCTNATTEPVPMPLEPGEPAEPASPGEVIPFEESAPPASSAGKLPRTGGGAETFAKTATGLATIITGGLLIFWGLLWPGSGRGDWSTPIRRSG